jgi:CBS domain-containing protein
MVSTISKLMTKKVITVRNGSMVKEAVSLMTKHGISCVIVVDQSGKPVGIVTERDMVRRVLNNSLRPENTRIDSIMSSPVMTMSPEKRITEAINLMTRYHFRRAVIADKSNKLLGILTQSDLLAEVHKVQLELEEMNESLRKTVRSMQRYSKIGTQSARVSSLKKKITRLEKELEKAKRSVEKSGKNPRKK